MNIPKCDTCGAEITTGLMAAFCSRGERCEFWPDDPESQLFLREFRESSQSKSIGEH